MKFAKQSSMQELTCFIYHRTCQINAGIKKNIALNINVSEQFQLRQNINNFLQKLFRKTTKPFQTAQKVIFWVHVEWQRFYICIHSVTSKIRTHVGPAKQVLILEASRISKFGIIWISTNGTQKKSSEILEGPNIGS